MNTIRLFLDTHLKKLLHAHFNLKEEQLLIKLSDRPDLADYQSNAPLMLSKKMKMSPREMAVKIQENWPLFEQVELSIAGPGFLNFTLTDSLIFETLSRNTTNPKLGFEDVKSPLKVLVDYGGPNTAKPMHVGHLRSSIIGEALKRLYRFAGHDVIGDIHLGDWGTQMGMLLVGLKEQYPEWVYFDPSYEGDYPEEAPLTLESLEALYPKMSQRCKTEETVAQLCREATQQLQQGCPGYHALWQHFVDLSVTAMKKEFDRLGVSFDLWHGESRYQPALAPLVEAYKKKGLAHLSEGAVIVPVAQETDSTDMPPVILQKSDGGYLYATTDLATLQERVEVYQIDKILYVVDGRQRLHFDQVFRAAKMQGWTADTIFIGFGTMNGPDGKPFKTRSGGVMKLGELIDQLESEALSRVQAQKKDSLSAEEEIENAKKIGIGALKFADLQHDPKQNYQFDIDKFLRFEGKTGPYLQYAAVRIASILSKVGGEALQDPLFLKSEALQPYERALALHLIRFPEVIEEALQYNSPNVLCEAAFQLAQSFSSFYGHCPVLTAEKPEQKQNRLQFCSLTLKILSCYLSLLGIEIPNRM